jgi:hypothetical protein
LLKYYWISKYFIANAIGVKAQKEKLAHFLIEIAWRIDAVVSWMPIVKERKLTQAVAILLIRLICTQMRK